MRSPARAGASGWPSSHIYWAGCPRPISRPTSTAPARRPSSPGRTLRSGWRSTPATCTGPTPERRHDLGGQPATAPARTPSSAPGSPGRDVRSAASHLYWADAGSPRPAARSGRPTWTAATRTSSSPGRLAPVGVAVNASHFYWSTTGDNRRGRSIWQANLDGSSPQAIVTGQIRAVRGGGQTPATCTGPPPTATGASIGEANLDGTSPHAIVTGQNAPFGVAADASHLYWTNERWRHDQRGQPRRHRARSPSSPARISH